MGGLILELDMSSNKICLNCGSSDLVSDRSLAVSYTHLTLPTKVRV